MAAKALLALFDGSAMLFSRRVTLSERGFHRDKASPRRTIIALLGLQRLADSGQRQPFDLLSIQSAVLQDRRWIKGIGDLGLLVRFAAECRPEKLKSIADEVDFGNVLQMFADGRERRTADLACFLAGISHARLACPDAVPDLTDVAVDTYRLLEGNQGAGGIFVHAGLPSLLQQPFSNRFGAIADQSHAIYALATFARAFDIEEPLAAALNCANAIRAQQGDMGQWWFLYDKRTSQVVNRYPVSSICQDGLVPMALLALGEETGLSCDSAISSGLSWVAGANELGVDLRDLEHGIIWDSIEPKVRITNFCDAALSRRKSSTESHDDNLRIRFEARPDHFGWLLYALSRFGIRNDAVTAKAAGAGG